jgi:hypothetical protein
MPTPPLRPELIAQVQAMADKEGKPLAWMLERLIELGMGVHLKPPKKPK